MFSLIVKEMRKNLFSAVVLIFGLSLILNVFLRFFTSLILPNILHLQDIQRIMFSGFSKSTSFVFALICFTIIVCSKKSQMGYLILILCPLQIFLYSTHFIGASTRGVYYNDSMYSKPILISYSSEKIQSINIDAVTRRYKGNDTDTTATIYLTFKNERYAIDNFSLSSMKVDKTSIDFARMLYSSVRSKVSITTSGSLTTGLMGFQAKDRINYITGTTNELRGY